MPKRTKIIYIVLLMIAAIMINYTAASTINKIAVIGVAVIGVMALLATPTVEKKNTKDKK